MEPPRAWPVPMAVDRLKRRLSAGLGTRRSRVARVRPGTPPGTLVAAGAPTPARISVLAYNREGATERPDAGVDDALPAAAPGGGCFGVVREGIRQGRGRVREVGADYLAYLLIDSVVDAYFPVIEQFGERIQHLESAAIDDPSPIVLVQMQRLRHQLLTLRRALWPMREEIGILQSQESDLVAPETRLYPRDVYDHAVQALEIVVSLR